MRITTLVLVLVSVMCARAGAENLGPIVAEGDIEAPVDSVWAAWATGAGLRSWLAPHAEIDMRLGGLMRTNYHADGELGDAQTIENQILAYDPGRMIAIKVTKFPEGFPFPHAIGDMWTVLYFDEAGLRRTHLRVVGLGFSADKESQEMRTFFDQGNAITLKELQHRFSGAREPASPADSVPGAHR